MACPDPAERFYRPRRPRDSPLHQLLDQHFDTFERVYAERYQPRYGVLRSAIRPAVTGFLKCGDLHHGFARVRCPDCQHEMFVAFSCRKRCRQLACLCRASVCVPRTGRWQTGGGTMRVISFIERRQTDVIEKIPRQCELWDPPTRAPPAAEAASADGSATDLEVEADPEYEQWLPACGRQVGEP